MDQPPLSQHLRFLFRSEQGRIGKRDWWQGVAILAAILVVATLIWKIVAPFTDRGLDERAMIDPGSIVAYTYSLLFALIIMLCAVSFIFCFFSSWILILAGWSILDLMDSGYIFRTSCVTCNHRSISCLVSSRDRRDVKASRFTSQSPRAAKGRKHLLHS